MRQNVDIYHIEIDYLSCDSGTGWALPSYIYAVDAWYASFGAAGSVDLVEFIRDALLSDEALYLGRAQRVERIER